MIETIATNILCVLLLILVWSYITTARARKELHTLQRLSSIYGKELDSVIRVAKTLRDLCESSDQEREAELHSRLASAELNHVNQEEEEDEA